MFKDLCFEIGLFPLRPTHPPLCVSATIITGVTGVEVTDTVNSIISATVFILYNNNDSHSVYFMMLQLL